MKEYYDWLATGKYAETTYQSLDCGETFREALIEYQKKVVITNKNNERNYLFQEKQDDFQQKSDNGTLMKQAAISCYFFNESRYNIDKIKISFSNNTSDEFNDNWLLDELNHKYQTESQDSSFKELIDITIIVSVIALLRLLPTHTCSHDCCSCIPCNTNVNSHSFKQPLR